MGDNYLLSFPIQSLDMKYTNFYLIPIFFFYPTVADFIYFERNAKNITGETSLAPASGSKYIGLCPAMVSAQLSGIKCWWTSPNFMNCLLSNSSFAYQKRFVVSIFQEMNNNILEWKYLLFEIPFIIKLMKCFENLLKNSFERMTQCEIMKYPA